MQTCRKMHRKCTVFELIGKVSGKLEGKETQPTGGNHYFCIGKYSDGCHWIRMKITCNAGIANMEKLTKNPCKQNGSEKKVKLPRELVHQRKRISVS